MRGTFLPAAAFVLFASGFGGVGVSIGQAGGAAAAPSNPYDACTLVTMADLQTAFGAAFTVTDRSDDGEARICQYESQVQRYVVSVYTNKKDRAEFDADAKKAATPGAAPIHSVTSPAYAIDTFARLVAWKGGITVTVDASDVTAGMTPEQLAAVRVKLVNIALSRVK